jgi:hypothetical protein
VLAKLQCATRCIRDIVPIGRDPEQACDIELRFVFAVERDVRRLVAGQWRNARRDPGKFGKTAFSATMRPVRDVGTLNGVGPSDLRPAVHLSFAEATIEHLQPRVPL